MCACAKTQRVLRESALIDIAGFNSGCTIAGYVPSSPSSTLRLSIGEDGRHHSMPSNTVAAMSLSAVSTGSNPRVPSQRASKSSPLTAWEASSLLCSGGIYVHWAWQTDPKTKPTRRGYFSYVDCDAANYAHVG